MEKPQIVGMNTAELEVLAQSLGAPAFRGRQIARWVYRRLAREIEGMSDLPKAFREKLGEAAVLYRAKILQESKSPDGTTKFLLEMEDGRTIESVLLPYEKRVSVCVSTQVGCAVGCPFCATGISRNTPPNPPFVRGGARNAGEGAGEAPPYEGGVGGVISGEGDSGSFERNLSAGEIVDEVLTLQEQDSRRISHVVYMGMGEPLLNYDNMLKSIHLLNDEVGIGMRHITISTVGITPPIERLAEENLQVTLAVSLHAPNDELRRRLIPISAKYPLKGLLEACRRYAEVTGRRITFEYMLVRDLNDSSIQAHELAHLLRGILCNVNLIPYNAVEGLGMSRPSQARVRAFRDALESEGINVTQRMERGHTISAACGQLRKKHLKVEDSWRQA